MKKIILLLTLIVSCAMYAQDETMIKLNKKTDSLNTAIKKAVKEKKSVKKVLDSIGKKAIKNSEMSYIDTTQTIIYNFKTKEYTKSNVHPRVGEPLVFKIKNINRLAYDIKIQSEDVAIADEYFNNEIKSIVSENKSSASSEIITEANIPSLDLNKDSFKNQTEEDSVNQAILIKNKIESLNLKLKSLEELRPKLVELYDIESLKDSLKSENLAQEEEIIKNRINTLLGITETDLDKIKTKLNDEIESTLADIENEQKTLKTTNELYQKLYQAFTNLINNYTTITKEYQRMVELERDYATFRTLALDPLLTKKKYIDNLENGIFISKNKLNQEKIVEYENLLNSFYTQYNIVYNDWNLMNELTKDAAENIRLKYQIIKNEVDKIKNAINPTELSKSYIKVMAMDKILRDDKCYEMASSPIQPQEDYVTFKVNITHRDKNDMAEYNDNREFTYMEYTKGGVRFDFSTGVVIDMGFDNEKYGLRNESYIDIDGNTVNGKQIVVTDRNRFSPNLAGMFHASLRGSRPLTFGLTLGASLNVETFQLNSIFPGVSVLWGKKQKFIFTTGPAFKLVKSLKENYQGGFKNRTVYPETEFGDNFELTSDQYRIGWFFGITYNLTSKQKGKFKIDNN
ncbi:hypothetical protein E0W68_05075 [Flavobacterium salilacus subsp. salilacus]|uniref:hypothetical protein n=1 Tax=Flavobacterium TaxID=237 RepID=UPI0010750C65|nr:MULTISPECIES: hypothetical protein [Flavobacterium]KAF2519145.1 hypothetical protein E0W68_05075 [Flavobacterium salilacus subsp. salilacus]MBE1613324.1 hypothetical protein [Flavobacterium sp. SaA2.13]